MFDVLSNENTINELAEENPSLLKRLLAEIKQFISDIKNIILGDMRIKLYAGRKEIVLLTDEYTKDKALFSDKGRTSREVNARIRAIHHFADIIINSKFNYTMKM